MAREVRIIASGDHHLSNSLPFAKPSRDGRTDRLDDQISMFDQMGNYAEDNSADAIFLLGDLHDKARLDPITLVESARIIKGLSKKAPTYILPGNHDAASIQGVRFNVEMFREMEDSNIIFMETGMPLPIKDVVFWPVEYMPIGQTKELLDDIRRTISEEGCGPNVLLFHNAVIGCEHLAWVCDSGIHEDELLEGFDWAIGGHFHTHQRFGDENQGMYTGAPMQHNFGDSGEVRGFWDIRFKDGKRKDKLVPVNAPRFWKAEPAILPDGIRPGDYLVWIAKLTHADFEAAKADLQRCVEEARAEGIHADFKHKPIYHHEARIVKTDEMAELTLEAMVGSYVESSDVELGGLDPDELKRVGHEIMAEASVLGH